MIKNTLFFIVVLLMMQLSLAQIVTIGTGTDNNGLPVNPYFGYTYSQCLYLASEINQSGDIYRITYKGKADINLSDSNDWTVYIGHTTNTTLTNNTWIPISTMTEVHTGTVTVVNDNVQIELNTPFNYNGTDNLVIAVDENTSGFDGTGDYFHTTDVTGQRSLVYRNDNTNPDPSSPPATTIGQNVIANIDLDFNATVCNAPTNLNATNISTTSADLSWTSEAGISTWNIEYGEAGFTQGAGTIDNGITTNPYAVTGLTHSTSYEFYIQSDCSGLNSSWTGPFTFYTTCLAFSTPYFEGFENGYTHGEDIGGCLSQESISGSGKWEADNYIENGSSLHPPRTGDWNGLLHTNNQDWLYIPIELTQGIDYTVKMYAKYSESPSATGTITIKYGTSPDAASMTNSIVDVTQIPETYQKLTGTLTPATSGVYYVGIYGEPTTASFNYMSIDDIRIIETSSCIEVEDLTATNITATSVNLGWTEIGTATTWNIEYGETGFSQGTGTVITATNDNPYNLTGLSAQTDYDYYIQSDCGSGDTSIWIGPSYFTTACAPVASFPYTEDFESITSGQPICWGIAGDTPVNSHHWFSHDSGNPGRGMKFDCYNNPNGKTSELISPFLDLSSLTTAELSFDFKNPTGGNLEVFISTDGGTNYTSLETNLTNQAEWETKTYDISSSIGSNVVIKFKGTSNWGNGDAYIYLDNFKIKEITSLGTNNVEALKNNITFYPNPVKDVLNIEATKSIQKVTIYNINGQEVFSKLTNNNFATLNTTNLKQGVYFAKVLLSNNVIEHFKLIKE